MGEDQLPTTTWSVETHVQWLERLLSSRPEELKSVQ